MFSIVPTVFPWLVVFSLLGAGPLGLRLDVDQVLLVSALAQHAVYGLALGLSYPMLLLARGFSGIPDEALIGSAHPPARLTGR
jgi:hypothetical protein